MLETREVDPIQIRNERNCRERSPQRKRRYFFSGSVRPFRIMVGRSDSQSTKKRFGTPFRDPVIPLGAEVDFLIQTQRKTKKSSSSSWYKDVSRNIHRIRAEFWRRLDWRRLHRGLARHWEQRRVQSSRQEIQVRRSWNQEQPGFIFLCAVGSLK